MDNVVNPTVLVSRLATDQRQNGIDDWKGGDNDSKNEMCQRDRILEVSQTWYYSISMCNENQDEGNES